MAEDVAERPCLHDWRIVRRWRKRIGVYRVIQQCAACGQTRENEYFVPGAIQ